MTPPDTPSEAVALRDLIADSRQAVQSVGQAAQAVERAAERVPTVEALQAAYWHGVALGAAVTLAAVCVLCVLVSLFRRDDY